jgi:hypothetical protein
VKVDEILDWIEADDDLRRHKPARLVDGQWAVTVRASSTDLASIGLTGDITGRSTERSMPRGGLQDVR